MGRGPGILRGSVCDFVVMHWFYSSSCSGGQRVLILKYTDGTMCDEDPPTPGGKHSETQPDEEEEEEESLCTRGGASRSSSWAVDGKFNSGSINSYTGLPKRKSCGVHISSFCRSGQRADGYPIGPTG